MITSTVAHSAVREMTAKAKEGIANRGKVANVKAITGAAGDVQKFFDLIDAEVTAVNAIVKAPVAGFTIPDHVVSVDYSGGNVFSLTIKSRRNASVSFKNTYSIGITENVVENIGSAFIDSLTSALLNTIAKENVEEVNEILDGICENAGVGYKVHFTIDPSATSFVAAIKDDEVVFVATQETALRLSADALVRTDDTEYTKILYTQAEAKFIDDLKTCQTPVQFIKQHNAFTETLTGVRTKKTASKIIRETYHKSAESLVKGKKAGIGYVDTDKYFALVEKDAEGKLSVALKPFDKSTYEVVKADVLKDLK